MAITKYGDISPRTAAYAAAEMLKRAQPYLVLQQFAQTKPIPANATQTVKFRRYEALALATTPIVEGVTPTGKTLTHIDVPTSLSQFGDFITLTDVIKDTHEDAIFKETQMLIGEQAAQTVETLLFNVLKAGTSVVYANGELRTDVNTVVDLGDIRTATRTLKRQNARYLTKRMGSTAAFNSESIAPGFIGFIHPDIEPALRNIAGYKDVVDYGSMTPFEFEVGAIEDVRFIRSTVFENWADSGDAVAGLNVESTTGTNADVYPIIIISADAFATVPLKGNNAITPMVLNPGIPREGDPMGQRGYVSWKTYWAGLILNQNWMVRIETAAPNQAGLAV